MALLCGDEGLSQTLPLQHSPANNADYTSGCCDFTLLFFKVCYVR